MPIFYDNCKGFLPYQKIKVSYSSDNIALCYNAIMNAEYYRVFLTVGRVRSITRAAEELFTSQPAITRTIKNLENELGTKLFTRSKRGVELTREGQILYEHVEMAFTMLEKGEREIASATSLSKGAISIGTTITALDEFLFDFIEYFRSAYPGIRLKLNTQSSDKTISALRQGQVDVAFITTPFKSYPDLKQTKLKEFENIVICGSEFLELRQGVHSLKELSAYPFVYLSTAMQLREYTDAIFAKENVKIEPLIELDGASMIMPMVAKNLGVSIVPKSLVKEGLKQKTVFEVKLDKPLPKRQVLMAESLAFPQSGALKEFLSQIKKNNL